MLSLIIWWACLWLEAVLLLRSLWDRLFPRFPIFFGYILFVMCQSIVRHMFRVSDPLYKPIYWSTEFLALLIGGLVVFEVYRLALQPFPGTAKMTRNVLFFFFALALARAINVFWSDPYVLRDATGLQIERPLRTFQVIAICSLIALLLAYSIPLSRNLRGILLGYSVFIGERVLCLAFVGETGRDFWYYAYSASYLTALGIWLTHLWSPEVVPHHPAALRLEQDYNLIAARTHERLRDARDYFRHLF
jgi:hypothetical protein